jgi:hypothetical protein
MATDLSGGLPIGTVRPNTADGGKTNVVWGGITKGWSVVPSGSAPAASTPAPTSTYHVQSTPTTSAPSSQTISQIKGQIQDAINHTHHVDLGNGYWTDGNMVYDRNGMGAGQWNLHTFVSDRLASGQPMPPVVTGAGAPSGVNLSNTSGFNSGATNSTAYTPATNVPNPTSSNIVSGVGSNFTPQNPSGGNAPPIDQNANLIAGGAITGAAVGLPILTNAVEGALGGGTAAAAGAGGTGAAATGSGSGAGAAAAGSAAAGGAAAGASNLIGDAASGIPSWLPSVLTALGSASGIVGSTAAANAQADAAQKAAEIQKQATDAVLAQQQKQYDQQRADLQPWMQAGQTALGQLGNLTSDANWKSFGMDQFQQDPGYQFRLDQGMKALQNSAAARGGLLSGNTMKGITDYSQGAASQEYQNAFNRYQTERNSRLNSLQSLAGLGQTAVGQSNQASQNYTDGMSQATLGGANALAGGMNEAANARASGYMGATNALTNALSDYVKGQRQDSYINALGGY